MCSSPITFMRGMAAPVCGGESCGFVILYRVSCGRALVEDEVKFHDKNVHFAQHCQMRCVVDTDQFHFLL